MYRYIIVNWFISALIKFIISPSIQYNCIQDKIIYNTIYTEICKYIIYK